MRNLISIWNWNTWNLWDWMTGPKASSSNMLEIDGMCMIYFQKRLNAYPLLIFKNWISKCWYSSNLTEPMKLSSIKKYCIMWSVLLATHLPLKDKSSNNIFISTWLASFIKYWEHRLISHRSICGWIHSILTNNHPKSQSIGGRRCLRCQFTHLKLDYISM